MFAAYAAIVLVASLNRETGVILVLCHAAYFPTRRIQTAMLAALWAVVTIGLHLWLGAAPIQYSLQATLATNLQTLPEALLLNALLVPLWILVGQGYRSASPCLKRLCAVALVYVVMVMFGGVWREVRLLLVIFPIILPIIPPSLPSNTFPRA